MTGVPPESTAMLREMCRCLADLRAAGGTPARRIAMTAGPVSLEVEWAPSPAAPDPAAPDPAAAVPAPTGSTPVAEVPEAEPGPAVVAPLVGTFYRAPQPGSPPFVEVGDPVEAGQQVGIVEAMKLMNPVVAQQSGLVARIAVGDGEAVEYEQPLIVLTAAVGGD